MKIIVVEDSPTQAAEIRSLLSAAGYDVDVAVDGVMGLGLCRESRPALVISDVLMPNMDGFELCRTIKDDADLAPIPVLLLTSLGEPKHLVQAVRAGAEAFLTKPYRDTALLKRVRAMIESRGYEDGIEVDGERISMSLEAPRVAGLLMSALEDAIERNRQLEAARSDLERANADRNELMGIVAHELRTPMQSLLVRSELALVRNDEATFREMPKFIKRHVGDMIRLIDDLLDLARLDSGRLRVEPKESDVGEITRRAIDSLSPYFEGYELQIDVEEGLTAMVDPARIGQVITNFVTNAFKYSDSEAKVRVEAKRRNDHARAAVHDGGIGIEAAELGRVFERYFRGREGKRAASGAGLGLYICRRLVELNGGRVGADSVPGKGSTFWFEVPLAGVVRSS